MATTNDLTKICDTLNDWQQSLKSLMHNPIQYDSKLNLPFWRSSGIEDFVKEAKALAIRFLVHANLLQTEPDYNAENKIILVRLGNAIKDIAQSYTPPLAEPTLNQRLISELGNLGAVLQKFTPPSPNSPPTPPRP